MVLALFVAVAVLKNIETFDATIAKHYRLYPIFLQGLINAKVMADNPHIWGMPSEEGMGVCMEKG